MPELSEKSGGSLVRPDGTVRDRNSLPRGDWEARTPKDDLDAEIRSTKSRMAWRYAGNSGTFGPGFMAPSSDCANCAWV